MTPKFSTRANMQMTEPCFNDEEGNTLKVKEHGYRELGSSWSFFVGSQNV